MNARIHPGPILALAIFLACGSEGAPQPPDPAAPAPATPGTGAPPSSNPCERYDLVLPPRTYGKYGGVIYMMAADESHLYYLAQSEDGVFKVPVSGGEPERLVIEGEQKLAHALWLREGSLLLYFGGGSGKAARLATMPLAGGALTPFLELTDFVGAQIRSHEFGADGTTFYRVGDLLIGKGTRAGVSGIFKVDLAARTHVFLPTADAELDYLARAGGAFFFSTGSSFVKAGALASMNAEGGPVTPLLPTMALNPILGDDSFVYLIGSQRDEQHKKRLYRLPAAGGEPTVLRDAYHGYFHSTSTADGHIFDFGDDLAYVPRGGGELTKIGCSESHHGLTAVGRTVYVSVVTRRAERVNDKQEASIARYRF